jgi:hypothetical protein
MLSLVDQPLGMLRVRQPGQHFRGDQFRAWRAVADLVPPRGDRRVCVVVYARGGQAEVLAGIETEQIDRRIDAAG